MSKDEAEIREVIETLRKDVLKLTFNYERYMTDDFYCWLWWSQGEYIKEQDSRVLKKLIHELAQ